jgi:hypothetical protein
LPLSFSCFFLYNQPMVSRSPPKNSIFLNKHIYLAHGFFFFFWLDRMSLDWPHPYFTTLCQGGWVKRFPMVQVLLQTKNALLCNSLIGRVLFIHPTTLSKPSHIPQVSSSVPLLFLINFLRLVFPALVHLYITWLIKSTFFLYVSSYQQPLLIVF